MISQRPKIKTIILDFDGTIVESVGIKDDAFQKLFIGHPEHISSIMEYHLSHNATVRFEKFRHITENILGQEYNEETERHLGERFSEMVFRKITECPYVPGAEDFLDHFFGRLPLYLASASPAAELEKILEARNLGKYFKKIYAIPWVKSDVIRDILERESILPDEAVFIGDAFEDYKAAQETGVFFIGRDSGKPFHDKAIFLYEDLFSIKYILNNFLR
jgi:phosphoglycolate phosphatase-like HAD superfamily hydrolase